MEAEKNLDILVITETWFFSEEIAKLKAITPKDYGPYNALRDARKGGGKGHRGAVVKGVEHISTIVLVNIWVARVRVPLVVSVVIWICKISTINT